MDAHDIIQDRERFPSYLQKLLKERTRHVISSHGLTPSAVLVPICYRDEGFSVLLTRRSMNVQYHKGEVAFPGGSIEPSDNGPESAALRESWEEIGLRPEAVHVLGRLDDHVTLLGFHIVPVVGLIPGAYDFKINTETDSLFYVPLKAIVTDSVWQGEEYVKGQSSIMVYYLKVDNEIVWGATARILKHLADLIVGREIKSIPISPEARRFMEARLTHAYRGQ